MVSIVVPIYNAEEKLERCVLSLLNQTYEDTEIILIDDGSVDKSFEICKRLAEIDKRIRIITRENCGVSVTRNQGIKLAKGRYIAFVDCDDYVHPYMIEKLVERIEEDKSDMVVFGITETGNGGVRTNIPTFDGVLKISEIGEKYPDVFNSFILNSPCDKLFRMEKLSTAKFPEDLSCGEDLLFVLDYLNNSEYVSFGSSSFYYYDRSEDGLNSIYRSDAVKIQKRLYTESLKFVEKYNVGEKAISDISNIFVRFFIYGMSDLYSCSGMDFNSCKCELKSWVNDKELHKASEHATLTEIQYKIINSFLRNKKIDVLHGIFVIRSKMRKEKDMNNKKKILVEGMTSNMGGMETFIYDLYLALKDDWQVDFLTVDEEIPFEKEFLNNGSHIYRVTKRSENPVKHILETNRLFKNGEYNVFWFNKTTLSNIESLKAAKRYGVEKVICHSHQSQNMGNRLTAIMHDANRRRVGVYSDIQAACSNSAAQYFYGKTNDVKIFRNAVDVSRFTPNEKTRRSVRQGLGIPEDILTLCLVARFREEKNHIFLIEIFEELLKHGEAKLLLCGEGELESEIKNIVKKKGLEDRVMFLGVRKDIENILQASDVFVMPSLYEGLPFSLVEAQAAGLPCIVSDTVSNECKLTDLVYFESLDSSPKVWAKKIISIKRNKKIAPVRELEEKGFTLDALFNEIRRVVEDL